MNNNQQSLQIRDKAFVWGEKTYLMAVLNVTPDSFSDGGKFNTLDKALKQAEHLIAYGADILDIGGQSTRPGAEIIPLEVELERVIPVIKAVREVIDIPISIDTTRAEVAKEAVAVGADIINDISGGTYDENMFSTTAKLDVPIMLMHIRGTPKTMQQQTNYQDLIGEIIAFLKQQIDLAVAVGIKESQIIIDPGIGFAKTHQQNLEILRKLKAFKQLNTPLLVGSSRKRFIGEIIGKDNPQDRVWGTAATCCAAIAAGADILRIHDLPEMYDVSRVADAIWRNHTI